MKEKKNVKEIEMPEKRERKEGKKSWTAKYFSHIFRSVESFFLYLYNEKRASRNMK